MTASTAKLIAALAISASLLTTNAVFAKGGPGKSNGSSNHSQSLKTSSTFNSFKLNSSNSNSSNQSNSVSSISKKNLTLSQTFKKQDSNKDHKNSPIGISLSSMKNDKKLDKNSKDFCKKDNKCWFDWCYSKNYCYPYYFGCYYPTCGCYDYCTPTYTTCSYNISPPLVPNVEPTRSLVIVGSILMINGQAFGNQAGGARLRLNGMAMPIEVLEWTPAGVKVRMPQLEMGGVTPAEIEVFRGDGSLASKMPINLSSSAAPLALGR